MEWKTNLEKDTSWKTTRFTFHKVVTSKWHVVRRGFPNRAKPTTIFSQEPTTADQESHFVNDVLPPSDFEGLHNLKYARGLHNDPQQ